MLSGKIPKKTESSDIIFLDDIGFWRGERTILENITWRVRPGEHWAIVGPNGSGKTTVLRIAVGYLWPTSGSVSVLGNRYGQVDIRELRKRIGWVSASILKMIRNSQVVRQIVLSGAFASTALFDEPTDAQIARAEQLIAQMGLDKIPDTKFGVLSLGEKQRTLLARSLMAEPELLILDEACAGLDINAREHLLARLDHLAADGGAASLVMVTHHIEEISPGFTHALVLKEGRVLAAGPTGEVLTGEILSDAFALDMEVHAEYGRFWARIRSL